MRRRCLACCSLTGACTEWPGQMQPPRHLHEKAACLQVCLVGGASEERQLGDAWLLDAAAGTWEQVACEEPMRRAFHTAQLLNGQAVSGPTVLPLGCLRWAVFIATSITAQLLEGTGTCLLAILTAGELDLHHCVPQLPADLVQSCDGLQHVWAACAGAPRVGGGWRAPPRAAGERCTCCQCPGRGHTAGRHSVPSEGHLTAGGGQPLLAAGMHHRWVCAERPCGGRPAA